MVKKNRKERVRCPAFSEDRKTFDIEGNPTTLKEDLFSLAKRLVEKSGRDFIRSLRPESSSSDDSEKGRKIMLPNPCCSYIRHYFDEKENVWVVEYKKDRKRGCYTFQVLVDTGVVIPNDDYPIIWREIK